MALFERWEFEKLLDEAIKKEDAQVTFIKDAWAAEYDKILKNEFVRFCAESDLDYDPNWGDDLSNYWTRDFSDQFNFTDREYVRLAPVLVRIFDDPEIVAAAVFCDPNVIKFASERIQKNPDVLIPYQKIHEQDRPVVQLNKPTGKGMER